MLFAATAAEVNGGEYFGPSGFMELKGAPTKVNSKAPSHDVEVARRLWDVSKELTGVRFEGLN